MNETKPALSSKTIVGNSTVFALYTIAKWAFPDMNIPEEVIVSLLTIGNILLRIITTRPIGEA